MKSNKSLAAALLIGALALTLMMEDFASAAYASSQKSMGSGSAKPASEPDLDGADVPQSLALTPGPGAPIKVATGSPVTDGVVAQVYSQTSLCPGCAIPGVGISFRDPTRTRCTRC